MPRNKRMETAVLSDGVEMKFWSDPANGAQHVSGTVKRDATALPSKYHTYLLNRAYSDMVSQRLTGDYGSDCLAAERKLWTALSSGEWSPDAQHSGATPAEPSDLAVAIAKLTGRLAAAVQDEIDTTYILDDNGEPVLDERGRRKRKFTARYIAQQLADPANAALKVEMAKIADDRAKRLAKEAREANKAGASPQGPSLASMFGTPDAIAAE